LQSLRGGDVIRFDDAWVSYSGSDRPAIRDVSLEIREGELVLITGPNGAGKTTLLETSLGLLKPFMGEVYLLGVKTSSRKVIAARKSCSYVPQDFMKPPFETYTVMHVILLGFAPYKSIFEGMNRQDIERAERVAELLGIESLLDRPIGTLSGGQQQRVVIARALARRPKVVLLDEPFASLDRESRLIISNSLRSYVDEENATAVVVSHDVNPIMDAADTVVKMKDGRIEEVAHG